MPLQLSYFLFFYGHTHICTTVLLNFMISFQVKLYNYNGSPRVLSFTSFPFHVGQCFTQLLLSTTVIHAKSPFLVRCFKITFLKQSLEQHSEIWVCGNVIVTSDVKALTTSSHKTSVRWVTEQRKPSLKILYPTLRDIHSDEIWREVSVRQNDSADCFIGGDIAFFLHFLIFLFLAILGAIPELSADSCKEIRASEGGEAVSGKYWLNLIKPDTPVLAHCDMKTKGRVRKLK